MSSFGAVLYYVLFIYLILLLARIVMETVFNFARDYQPHGVALLVLESIFSATDPPLKALRRLIPPVRLGQISLDLAAPVLFLALIIGMQVATQL